MSKKSDAYRQPANHVLVVDDIDTNLMFAEYLLNKVNPAGDVTCVLSAMEAIQLLKKDPYQFSMILLDIEMPDIDGIEAAHMIREFNKEIAIVALTAHGDAEMLQRCLGAGMDGVASKPFREPSIAKVVSTFNGKKSHYATQHYASDSDASKKSAWSRGFFITDNLQDTVDKYLKGLADVRFKKEKSKTQFLKQLGLSKDPSIFVPLASSVKDVAAGRSFIVMALSDGKVVVQGSSSLHSSIFPNGADGTPTSLPAPVTHVQAGATHVLAWSAGNRSAISRSRSAHTNKLFPATKHLFSWGLNADNEQSNPSGQLGRNLTATQAPPDIVEIEGNVVDVACGNSHTLVLTDVGLFGFGLDSFSQLGGQNSNVVPVPKSIFVGNNVITTVACGHNHSLLITAQSTVLCFGLNVSGQCGQPASDTVGRPTLVADLSDIVEVAGGSQHSLAVSKRGVVFSWGSNGHFQLGRRVNQSATHEPAGVQGALSRTPVSLISCGDCFSMAIDNTGNCWSWGCLQTGGATKHAKLPVQVKVQEQQSQLNNLRVLKVRSGGFHSVALLSSLGDGDSESFDSSTEDLFDNSFNEKTASMTLSAKVFQKVLRKKSTGAERPTTINRKSSWSQSSNQTSSEDDVSAERRKVSRSLSAGAKTHQQARLSSSSASPADLTLIKMPSTTDISLIFQSELADPRVLGTYDVYATRFLGQNHFLLIAKSAFGSKIIAVLRLPVDGKYMALAFTKYGIFETQVDQSLVLGADHHQLASPRDLHIKLLTYFINYGYHDFDQQLAGFPVEFSMQSREDASEISWRVVSATKTQLPNKLLSLEARLGMTKRITVGVFCNIDGETSEKAFKNEKARDDPGFKSFCKCLGSVVPKAEWPHFDGGMGSCKDITSIFYTSWRGFEIVFHLAPVMTSDLRRQYIGNDKCLIIYTESAVPAEFRGSVNSLALVVQSLNKQEAAKFTQTKKSKSGWRCGAYIKSSVWNFKSVGISPTLITSKTRLRNIIMANVVNGCAAVTSCLKAFRKVFQDEVESLVTEYFVEDEDSSLI